MGSGTIFDPIKSIEAFGLGSFNEEAATMDQPIPDVTSTTGAILPTAPEATFGETEASTVRRGVTKKRLGTGQAKIPLKTSSVGIAT